MSIGVGLGVVFSPVCNEQVLEKAENGNGLLL
jgi:hypothetical protein